MALRAKTIAVTVPAALVIGLAVLVRLIDFPFVAAVRDLSFDYYQRARPADHTEAPVRIADIDERALARFGQWPWPRTRLAELTDRLAELGAAAIAYDIVFPEPDRTAPSRLVDLVPAGDDATRARVADAVQSLPDPDAAFAAALERAPAVLGFATLGTASGERPMVKGGIAFAGADPTGFLPPFAGAARSLSMLEQNARGIGGVSLSSRDSTGVVRRIPMLFSDGERLYPSLATEALRVGFGASSLKVRATGASGETASGRSAVASVQIARQVVPTTAEGELWLRYARDRPSDYVSVADILDPAKEDAIRPQVEGHVVFVGTSAAGLQDLRGTALGDIVPGVSIHAQAVSQILSGDFLVRPDWADGLEVIAIVLIGLLAVGPLPVVGAVGSLFVGAFAAVLAVGGSWYAFTSYGLLIDPMLPLLAGAAAYLSAALALYITTDREKRFVRQAFSQYLTPDLVSELERSPESLKLGGEVRDATILFMDVRDFTSISERLAPDQIVNFLNTLLSPLSDAIQAERGTIDKYIGDSIMAFWNAPLPVPDHPVAACRAALAMRQKLVELDESGAFADIEAMGGKVKIGIGLNTGLACVGNMGSATRFNYSAIGDSVNIAARIESSSKGAGADILVSQSTADAAPDFAYVPVGEVPLKGKSQPLQLLALIGDATVRDSAEFQEAARLHASAMTHLKDMDFTTARSLIEAARAVAPKPMLMRLAKLESEIAVIEREVA